MNTQTQHTPTPDPAPLDRQGRVLLAVVGIPLAVWALVGCTAALRPSLLGGTSPIWMLAIFEAITLFTAVVLATMVKGRFSQGPAITAGLAALAIGVGAILGSISANNAIGDYQLRPHVIGRIAVAGIVGVAALMLAIRSTAKLLSLAIGAALVLPVLAALGLFVLGKLGRIIEPIANLGPAVSLVASIVAGLLGLAALAAGGHLLIAAFEIPERDAKPTPTNAE